MSNKRNDVLMDLAIDLVDIKILRGEIKPEDREIAIDREYSKLLMTEPTSIEEEMDDNSGDEL